MELPKSKFLDELSRELGNHREKDLILLEYEAHIDEFLMESRIAKKENATFETLIQQLGEPKEIAEMWKQELSITPSRMKWLFIFLNIFIFLSGSLLTLVHNLFAWQWIAVIWRNLTAIPTLISFIYLFFWALLGYEIGKGFGHGGRSLLRRTFFFSLIPNLILMFLTVFEIIPHTWFEPLLTKSFIIACILFTIFLYPVCLLGYRWGRKTSI